MTDLPATPPFALVAVDACTRSPLASRPYRTGDPEPPMVRVCQPGPALDREVAHRAAVAAAVASADADALVAVADGLPDDLHRMDRQRVVAVLLAMAEAMHDEAAA